MNAIKDYFIGAYRELRKVTWLTKKQIISHTIIVLLVSVAVSFFMTLFDFSFTSIYDYFINTL